MANNQIPERLINFKVYTDGIRAMTGIADIELPSFEALTDTLSGAGIAGELDTPTLGAFGSMAATINFRTATKDALSLASMRKVHNLSARGAIQVHDATTGQTKVQKMSVSMGVKTKTFNPGKMEANAVMDASFEGEIYTITIRLDGIEYIVLDKLNNVYKVNGIDELKEVRDAM